MKKIVGIVLTLVSMFFLNMGYAAPTIPNSDNDPKTFLGPMIQGSYTNTLSPTTAYSIAAEAGFRNYRLGGTVGWAAGTNQRVKFSVEYLLQKITYPFFVGNTSEWVQQAAMGAGYQLDLPLPYGPQFNLGLFYSHAPSKNLSTKTGTFINDGVPINFIDMRRIAGSNAAGFAPGLSLHPWSSGEIGVDINYDSVHYDKKFAPSEDAIGFGGTAHVTQLLSRYVVANLIGAWRQPFNNYQADFAVLNLPGMPGWIFDVSGAYTVGKNTLPSTYNFGVSVDYVIDRGFESRRSVRQPGRTFVVHGGPVSDLTEWTTSPAVYLPQVLAIPDEQVVFPSSCVTPILVGTLPNQVVTTPTNIAAASVFAGSGPFTFSVSTLGNVAPSTVTINPTTGLITITPVQDEIIHIFQVTVVATNTCGSALTSFIVIVPAIPSKK